MHFFAASGINALLGCFPYAGMQQRRTTSCSKGAAFFVITRACNTAAATCGLSVSAYVEFHGGAHAGKW